MELTPSWAPEDRFTTDRKSLLAVRGVGRESEAESVRFNGRRLAAGGWRVKQLPPEVRPR